MRWAGGHATAALGPATVGRQPRSVMPREALSARARALRRPAGGGTRALAIHDGRARLGSVRAAAAARSARLLVDRIDVREADRGRANAGKRAAREIGTPRAAGPHCPKARVGVALGARGEGRLAHSEEGARVRDRQLLPAGGRVGGKSSRRHPARAKRDEGGGVGVAVSVRARSTPTRDVIKDDGDVIKEASRPGGGEAQCAPLARAVHSAVRAQCARGGVHPGVV